MSRNRSGKKSIFPIIVIALIAYFIMTDSDDNPTGQAKKQPISSQNRSTIEGYRASKLEPFISYAASPLMNNWPKEQGNAEASVFTVSADLIAKNYYLVLDASGSMMDDSCETGNSNKMASAIDALSHFTAQLPQDANFGLAVFLDGELQELLPLGKNNRNDVVELVSRIVPNGGTPLDHAVDFGYQKLLAQGKRQQGYGEYNLVIVTDGLASSGHDPQRAVTLMLSEAPVALHTIGFCIEENHSLNQTGLTVYRSANDPESLKQGLVEVLAESPEFDLSSFSK
jgi:hypothetical protein